MFKKVDGKQKAHNKSNRKIPPHYTVKSARTILTSKKLQLLVARIETLAHVREDYWQCLYEPAIHNFIEFVQGLPAVKYEAFNKHNGFLILGIRRAIESLVAYRKNNPIKDIKSDDITLQDALHTYVIFTASLFVGLGQIPAIYWVSICNNKGFHGHKWQPMASSMLDQGTHYRYSYESINRDILANYLTPHIATSLMPHDGFVWISSAKDLLEAWLAFLQNDIERGGLIAEIILPIEDQLLQSTHFDLSFIASDDYTDAINTEKDPDDVFDLEEQETLKTEKYHNADSIQDTKRAYGVSITSEEISGAIGGEEIGIAFIEWLRYSIEGVSRRADRLVNFSKDGLAVFHPEAAQEFLKENPQYGKDVSKVLKSLQEHGLAKRQLLTVKTISAAKIGLAGMGKTNQAQTVLMMDPTLLNIKIPATIGNVQVNSTVASPNLSSSLKYNPNAPK